MDSDDKMGCLGAALTITAFVGGLICGFHQSDRSWEKDAVKHGAAEYVLDPATGKTTWRWKEGKIGNVENK